MTNPSKQKEDVQLRFRSGHSSIDGSSIGPTGITCVLSRFAERPEMLLKSLMILIRALRFFHLF